MTDDHIARLDHERRDVGLAAVDDEMAVADELAGLLARVGEAHAVDDVVQPALEELEQVVAGHAAAALRLVVSACGTASRARRRYRRTFCFSRSCNPYSDGRRVRRWPCWPGGIILAPALLDDRALRPVAARTLQ